VSNGSLTMNIQYDDGTEAGSLVISGLASTQDLAAMASTVADGIETSQTVTGSFDSDSKVLTVAVEDVNGQGNVAAIDLNDMATEGYVDEKVNAVASDLANTQEDVAALQKADVEIRNEIKTTDSAIRNDMQAADNQLRSEMQAADQQLNEKIDQVNANTNAKIDRLSTRVDKGLAGAAALAALHPLDYDEDAKLSFATGVGHYSGKTAVALGAFYRPNEKVMVNVGATVGDGREMVNAGVSFTLDRTNRVTKSKAALVKENEELRDRLSRLEAFVGKMLGYEAEAK
ncbi:MAG: YadA-like family protein, partial [Phascolarctobacterium sp.]|nr:YadA-like family protein [Phascolarctobacterium sp.]